MSKNIGDLNAHLFNQLDRLSEAGLQGDDLQKEIERSKAISGVSKDLIASAKLSLEAEKYKSDGKMQAKRLPQVLAIGPSVPK